MVGMLMEAASQWNLRRECPVGLVVLENIWAEALLLDLDAALIVVLMVTGLVIAKLETGRTSVIAVVREGMLKGTAIIVPRS